MSNADEAARSVLAIFGRPYLTGLLGEVARPGRERREWHYWWQAHLADCLLDAERRGSPEVRPGSARKVLRGVWLRNRLRHRNSFYDDMAWLALAALRMGRRVRSLDAALQRAITSGGAWWNTSRDYRNTAATGPITLYLARTGRTRKAEDLLDWLLAELLHPATGLFQDGLRTVGAESVLVPDVYTYNQGPALGAMLELGRTGQAAALVHAVEEHLTRPEGRVLRTHGGGDGGLFTGILTRYLALAATDRRMPAAARESAAGMVSATADHLWGRRLERGWRGRAVVVFPAGTGPGDEPGEKVELSTQLQAWMALEAQAGQLAFTTKSLASSPVTSGSIRS